MFVRAMAASQALEEGTDPLDLNWQGFHQWLVGFASIRFDLEQGQLVDESFPPGAISVEEETDVAFSSFPDSMSSVHNKASLHDCVFFFRMRRRGMPTFTPPAPPREYSSPAGAKGLAGRQVRQRHTDGSGSDRMNRSWTEPNPSASDAPTTLTAQHQIRQSPSTSAARSRDSSGNRTSPNLASLGQTGSASGAPGGNFRLPDAAVATSSAQRPSSAGEARPQSEGTRTGAGGTQGAQEGTRQTGASMQISPLDSAMEVARGSSKYLYGFVFNRQRHDERLPRGGEQKSVVVLTERPYSAIFRQLAQVVGPLFFDYGTVALVQVSHAVAQWPKPVLGASMELPVGHSIIRAQVSCPVPAGSFG